MDKILQQIPPGVRHFQFDSRKVEKGDFFFALAGEKVDGHAFLKEVAEKGALGAVVSHSYKGESFGLKLIPVFDVLLTLQQMAKEAFQSRREKVIAITGSMGKTTTKEFLASLIGAKYRVAKTEGSANSQRSIPLQILNLKEETDYLVLEMGMSEEGHITNLINIAPPDYAIVTRIAPAGIEDFVGGIRAVARAKGEILSHPGTKWGLVSWQAAQFPEVLYSGVATKGIYGWKKDLADPRIADYVMDTKGSGVVIQEGDGGKSPVLNLSVEGSHIQENFLAAVSMARRLGVSWDAIQQVAVELVPFSKRFEKIEKNGITYIQDSYNANPESMAAALTNLPTPKEGGKVVGILGSMADLGESSAHYHTSVGKLARGHLDRLLSIGKDAKQIQTAFAEGGKEAAHFSNLSEVKEALDRLVKPGDVVLIKGSNYLKLWELIEK